MTIDKSIECASSEIEPNNTALAPQGLSSPNAGYIFGDISPIGDQDFIQFPANAGDRIWLYAYTALSSTNADTRIALYSMPVGTQVQEDDDNGSQHAASSAIAGAPITSTGNYGMFVQQFSNTATVTPYLFFFDRTSGARTPEAEPNDSTIIPQLVSYGADVLGSLSSAGDVDVYRFAATSGDSIIIQIDGNPERDATATNPDFDLLDGAGALVLTVNSESQTGAQALTPSENFGYTANTTANVHVRVYSEGGSTGTYALHVWRTTTEPCVTTAGEATVSGRVLAPGGRGLTNAVVTISAPDGSSQSVITGRSGAFSFANIETGRTYVVSVGSRRFRYQPQAVTVNDNVTGLEFRTQ